MTSKCGSRRKKTGFSIAGRILFANCAVVAGAAFAGSWLSQRYADEPAFVLGTILFTGWILLSLPINYVSVKVALKPLKQLADTMHQVQAGNLEAGLAMRRPVDPQIADLLESYDTMIEWLRDDRLTIEKMSLIDPLTEVGNTRALHQGLEMEIARIDRYGQEMPGAFSVLILDMDRFKEINDNFGHLTGDAVLREMAHVLRQNLRKTDTTLAALKHFRFGGDEFVIIAPHTTSQGAVMLAARLDEAISQHPFVTHDGRLIGDTAVGQLQASIGYASYPEETASAAELLDLADKRMYAVKETRAKLRRLPTARPEARWQLGENRIYQ